MAGVSATGMVLRVEALEALPLPIEDEAIPTLELDTLLLSEEDVEEIDVEWPNDGSQKR